MKKKDSDEQRIVYAKVKSPIDDLLLVADDKALIGLYFSGPGGFPAQGSWANDSNQTVLKQTAVELEQYFAGTLKKFTIPVRLNGTDFQRKIWKEIASIPYGTTVTYSDLATGAGSPQAVRAAGTSTGKNPISIIVPCHRVIGKNGGMCGFGGGLPRKLFLLNLENAANNPLLI